MNWGTRIVILYVGFVALIMTLVGMSMSQQVDLVADDYYQQELKYQQRIDDMKNTNELSHRVTSSSEGENFSLIFPEEFSNKKIEGNLHFYCEYDGNKDVKTPFTSEGNTFSMNAKNISNGRYMLKLEWNTDGETYYQELPVSIHH